MDTKALINWSLENYQTLPWREDRSLYRTLVSEFMLQQTTVGTVLNRFENFLSKFPDLKSLAVEDQEGVVKAWEGLGYYRRARNLHKAAQYIYNDLGGEYPSSHDDLLKIPGVGDYTASSIIGIGKNQRAIAVDANLERVIARYFGLYQEKGIKLQREIRNNFENNKIFKGEKRYRLLNEALMDLGRTYCQARKVDCLTCPAKKGCYAFEKKEVTSLPRIKESKKKDKLDLVLNRIISLNKKRQVLLVKREKGFWLEGQYELPTFIEKSDDPKLKQYPEWKMKKKPDFNYKTVITKYRITNKTFILDYKERESLPGSDCFEWRDLGEENLHLSSATNKALKMAKLSDKPDSV